MLHAESSPRNIWPVHFYNQISYIRSMLFKIYRSPIQIRNFSFIGTLGLGVFQKSTTV